MKRGAALLSGLRMKGWPRKFECAQDYHTASRAKADIVAALEFYEQEMQPAEPAEILTRVEMLDIRGFQKDLPQAAMEQIELEWLEDLSEYPADLVKLACHRWRRACNNRPPYASGELMDGVKDEYRRRKTTYLKAKSVLEAIQ